MLSLSTAMLSPSPRLAKFGIAASFRGSTLAMIASLMASPTPPPSTQRNTKAFVAVAMSFRCIAA
ncbi:hypothetical protein L210DRAFT_3526241 [Boletus edulis BED1]|uniref:Uncharacterized protein n=1 Tax=Boletus edulis BED1 TaxID=1328754 RepID=A0AAD4C396_BOLED|nr:hypothetical protein L210DRAFT_3526241 [Boletus edulis BED1]